MMRKPVIVLSTGGGFLALALVLGLGIGPAGRLVAQNKTGSAAPAPPATTAAKKPSAEAQRKIDAALKALAEAKDALAREGLYDPAIEPICSFAVTTGGSMAARELEQGQPVDPETYAGLYVGASQPDLGLIRPELQKRLTTNDQGELLFNGKLVQIYPISRLKVLYQERAEAYRRVTAGGATATPGSGGPAAPPPTTKATTTKPAAPPTVRKETTKPAAPPTVRKETTKPATPTKTTTTKDTTKKQ